MKLKYFFGLLLSILFMTGCSEDAIVGSLEEISVDQTFVSLPTGDGKVVVTIKASQAWEFMPHYYKNAVYTKNDHLDEMTVLPNWLTASQVSGEAGETKVEFSAKSCEYGREAEVMIRCGEKTQFINVRQGSMDASKATCAEVIAGADGKTYIASGTVTSIANTTYGNWYLNDGTGEVYIYGTLDADGATKNFTSLGIEVGDVVTVQGPKTTYGTTVELVDVTVLKIEKALLKVMNQPEAFASEGGEATIKVAYKGSGVFLNIPEDCSWVNLKSMNYVAGVPTKLEKAPADTAIVTLSIAENTGSARAADVIISSKKDANSTDAKVTISQLGLSGTKDMPFTVAEAIAFCQNLSAPTTKDYYIKGKISRIKDAFTAQYGNATFWISDDGTCSVTADGKDTNDKGHDFEVYRGLWLGNQKWIEGNAAISEGDEVIICGQLTNYNGLAETNSGKAYVYSINGVETDANGIGSQDAPFNCIGAIVAAKVGISKKVYVSGIVSELVKGGFDPNYGNGSFWMSDNGTKAGDLTVDFEAYQVNYLGGAKWTEEQPQIAVGDKVTIYGPLTTYNGTSETQGKGAAYIYSLNGKTE